MSTLVARLPVAGPLAQGDYLVLNQGIPAVTRRATVAKVLAASTTSSGQVAPITLPPRGTLHIGELAVASTVYLNDTLLVDQGTPPISRLATVAQLLTASGSGSANTELVGTPADKPLSSLPLASAVALDDWVVINQTGPVTRRIKVSNLGIVAPSIFTEDFEHGVAGYSLVTGANPGDFVLASSPWPPLTSAPYSTPASGLKHIQNANSGTFYRSGLAIGPATSLAMKIKVLSEGSPTSNLASSDGRLNYLSSPSWSVQGRAAAGTDAAQRCGVTLGASPVYLATLTLDTWYEVTTKINPGSGQSVATLYTLASGSPVLVASGNIPGTVSSISITDIEFVHTNAGSFATEFDDIVAWT